MRSLTTIDNAFADLFRDFNRFSIGLEPTFRVLHRMQNVTNGGYPPYDLQSIGDNCYRLSMAVAGFTTDDLEITRQEDVLVVEGKSGSEEDRNYLYKGIASRDFRRMFYINPTVKVTSSNLSNGILTIDFEQEIPESMKPQKIAIGTDSPKVIEGNRA